MSALLRRLADWLDRGVPARAGRMHCSQLDGIQARDREFLYAALGSVLVMVDVPRRWSRPAPAKPEPVTLTWTSPA